MYYCYSNDGYYVTHDIKKAQDYVVLTDGFMIRYGTLDLYPDYSTEWEYKPCSKNVLLFTL